MAVSRHLRRLKQLELRRTVKRRVCLVGLTIVFLQAGMLLGGWIPVSREHSSRLGSVASDFQRIANHLTVFEARVGRLPTSAEGLEALISNPSDLPNWKRLLEETPTGPWGRPYQYIRLQVPPDASGAILPDRNYGLYCFGPDGVSATDGNDPDDVNSWSAPDYDAAQWGDWFDTAMLLLIPALAVSVYWWALERMQRPLV